MKVADLFALLRIKTDKGSVKKADTMMQRFAAKARDTFAGIARYGKVALAAGFALSTRDALKFNEQLERLNITAKGGFGSLSELRNKVLRVSNATGIAKEEVAAGASRFVELTGDVEGAAAAMPLFAKVAKATGATMDDVAGAGAGFAEQFKIAPDQLEKMFSIAIESGKMGAAELKDMAAEIAGLGAQSQKFANSEGVEAAARISAMLQTVTATTGGNVSEASTQITAMMTGLGQASKALKKAGVNVFDASGEYRELGVILEELKSKNLSAKEIEKMFPNVRAQRGVLAILRGDVEGLTASTLASNAVAEDFAKIQQSSSAKVKKAWNTASNGIAKAFAKIIDAMAWLTDELDFLVISLGVAVTAFVIFKAAAVKAALATAASWAVALAPMLLMVAILVGIALLIEDIWTAFQGGESITGDAHKWLVDVFVEAIAFWHKQFTKFFDWVLGKFDELKVFTLDAKAALTGGESETSRRARVKREGRDMAETEARIKTRTDMINDITRAQDRAARQDASMGIFEAGAGAGLFRQGTPMFEEPGKGGGGNTFNVVVNGAVDPLTTARVTQDAVVNALESGD